MKNTQIIGLIILLCGLSLICIPFASMIMEDFSQINSETAYSNYLQTKNIDSKRIINQLAETTLETSAVQDIFTQDRESAENQESPYETLIDTSTVIGQVVIPKLGQNFDLYLDADYDKLNKGVATLIGSGAPIGITGQRPIIAGHRVSYNNPFFFFLPNLGSGDKIFVTMLDQTLEYEVYSKEIIDEYEIDKLAPIPNQDIITLMTCDNAPEYNKRYLINARRVISNQEVKAPPTSIITLLTLSDANLSLKTFRLLPYFIVIFAMLSIGYFFTILLKIFTKKQ
ncbi:class C sortase [Streptococcus suis]